MIRLAIPLVLGATAATAHAAGDPCATFFWTGSQNPAVARYQPRYLVGEGLEDVGLGHIPGTRIRAKWSQQAASCLASPGSNGFFASPAFDHTACSQGEACFPGTRPRRMSERLTDVRDAVVRLATPSADPTYQASLDRARASALPVVTSMADAVVTTASFLAGLADDYTAVLGQLDLIVNAALPASVRTAVLDHLCAPANVARLGELSDACFEQDSYCELDAVYGAINQCVRYQDGATLDALRAELSATRLALGGERDAIAAEQAAIASLWTTISGNLTPPPASPASDACAIRYPFGTVQLAVSDRAAGHYGADLRLLYGDWDFAQTFGVATDASRTARYVTDVAGLVRDCLGDARHGRLDFARHQVGEGDAARPETDAEFYDRVFEDTLEVRRELADIELGYAELLAAHAPLVAPGTAVAALETIVSETVERLHARVADRTTGLGWVVVNLAALDAAVARFTSASALTRALIAVYLHQFPGLRDQVIGQLIANTRGVLDDYAAFYAPEARAALEALLAQAATIPAEHLDTLVAQLTAIANALEELVVDVWADGGPVRELATRLKLTFGTCDGGQRLATYFGDLAVTTRILEEGGDASSCAQ